MGQYYVLVNLDKEEVVNPHAIGGMAKLYEWCANTQAFVIPYLLAKSDSAGGGDAWKDSIKELKYCGRWAGDRIALVGDYDSSELYQKADDFTDISAALIKEFLNFVDPELYGQTFEDIYPNRVQPQKEHRKRSVKSHCALDMVISSNGAGQPPSLRTDMKT